jgi:hypothetical protein
MEAVGEDVNDRVTFASPHCNFSYGKYTKIDHWLSSPQVYSITKLCIILPLPPRSGVISKNTVASLIS